MDYMKFVEYHREQGADITVGCLPVDYERASDFGLMNIDAEGVVTVSSEQCHIMLYLLALLTFIVCCCLCTALITWGKPYQCYVLPHALFCMKQEQTLSIS